MYHFTFFSISFIFILLVLCGRLLLFMLVTVCLLVLLLPRGVGTLPPTLPFSRRDLTSSLPLTIRDNYTLIIIGKIIEGLPLLVSTGNPSI